MKKKIPLPLFLAVLAYLGTRLLILFTNFDAVALHGYELYPMGTMAKDIVEGGGFPLSSYFSTHDGGFFVTGFAAIPFYHLLGSTYFALKMVPLMFGLLLLPVLYYFLWSNFSGRAATLGVFLFTLAPVTLTKHSVAALGNHFEILLFITLLLFCHYRFLFGTRKNIWLIAGAILAGFALFHNFSSLIVIGSLALVHFGVRGYRKTAIDLALGVPFFLLGILPLIINNLVTGGGAWVFLEAKFTRQGLSLPAWIWERLRDFSFNHLPRAGCFEDLLGVPGRAVDLAWLFCFLAAFLATLPQFIKSLLVLFQRLSTRDPPSCECLKILPFGLYLPLFALSYGVGDFRLGGYPQPHSFLGYRYFQSQFFMAILLIAVAVSMMNRSHKGRLVRTAGIVLGCLSLLGGAFSLGQIKSPMNAERIPGGQYEGYFYQKMSRALVQEPYVSNPGAMERALRDLRPLFRCRAYSGIGYLRGLMEIQEIRGKAGARKRVRLDKLDLPPLLSGIPERHRIDVLHGIGAHLRKMVVQGDVYKKDKGVTGEILGKLMKGPDNQAFYVLEGMMLNQEFLLVMDVKGFLADCEKMVKEFPGSCRHALRRGQGILCGRLLRRSIPAEEKLVGIVINQVPEKERLSFFHGLGWGLADGGDKPALPRDFEKWIPVTHRNAAHAGFGAALRHIHGAEQCGEALESIKGTLPAISIEWIEAGMEWKDYPGYRRVRMDHDDY